MLFEQRCESCGGGDERRPLCESCTARLRSAMLPAPVRLHGVEIHAATIYDGVARNLVLVLKRRRSVATAGILGGLVVERLDIPEVDVVTWAPTSGRHVRERGHDQARLLASVVAHRLGVRPRRCLRRQGEGAQTGSSRRVRLSGPTFTASPFVVGRRILVIDDVVTTGATLSVAHRCLTDRGASFVACVAVAATPEPTVIR